MQNSGEKAMGCRTGEDSKDLLGLSREDNDVANLLGSVKMSSKFINNLFKTHRLIPFLSSKIILLHLASQWYLSR